MDLINDMVITGNKSTLASAVAFALKRYKNHIKNVANKNTKAISLTSLTTSLHHEY